MKYFLVAIVLGLVFLLDTLIPLGVAAGVLYLIPVYLAGYFFDRKGLRLFTVLSVLLILVGILISPSTKINFLVVLGNRFLSIIVLYIAYMSQLKTEFFDVLGEQSRREKWSLGLLYVFITTSVIFIFDINAPVGFSAALAYVVPIYFMVLLAGRQLAFIAICLSFLYIALSYWLHPILVGEYSRSVLIGNRVLSSFAIISLAFFILYQSKEKKSSSSAYTIPIKWFSIIIVVFLSVSGIWNVYNIKIISKKIKQFYSLSISTQSDRFDSRKNIKKTRDDLVYYSEVSAYISDFVLIILLFVSVYVTILSIGYANSRAHLKELNENLEKKVKQRTKELGEFNIMASHDMQEPLRNIFSLITMLREEKKDQLDSETLKDLNLIKKSVHRMKDLLISLLEFSNIGKTNKAEMSEVDMTEIVEAALDELSLKLKKTGAKVHFDRLPVVKGYKTYLGTPPLK